VTLTIFVSVTILQITVTLMRSNQRGDIEVTVNFGSVSPSKAL